MSPRLKRIRKVLNPPIIKGMKPYGHTSDSINQSLVTLLYEEYEALRMCDYDMITHHQASELMQVSRPTFTRIYATARQKIAQSLVEGRPTAIEGGKVYFDSDWYQCEDCKCYFNNPEKDKAILNCPLCGSAEFESYPTDIKPDSSLETIDNTCFCPKCGYENYHKNGQPCIHETCPKCSGKMRRKSKQRNLKLTK